MATKVKIDKNVSTINSVKHLIATQIYQPEKGFFFYLSTEAPITNKIHKVQQGRKVTIIIPFLLPKSYISENLHIQWIEVRIAKRYAIYYPLAKCI